MKAGDDTLGGGMKQKEAPEDSLASQREGTSGLDVNRNMFGIWNVKKDLRKGTLNLGPEKECPSLPLVTGSGN